jgi:hypothetical protein
MPTDRCGNRGRSSSPRGELSNRSSAGDTTISPGRGSVSRPGGTGAADAEELLRVVEEEVVNGRARRYYDLTERE